MSRGFTLIFSLSLSGGLLISLLILGKSFWKDRLSRQWQYYIWLAAVLRLLLPFGLEADFLPREPFREAAFQAAAILPEDRPDSAAGGEFIGEGPDSLPQEIGETVSGRLTLVWLAVALGVLVRKITAYEGFTRCVRAGMRPVSSVELLDRLALTAEELGVKRPIELCVNPAVSSPMLIGFFHPCVVLPDVPREGIRYIVLHELIHYKRKDLLYKWLVQFTLCLHWFNPLVHLMSREITRACEFSCDEAVLEHLGSGCARDYGKTLLSAMAAVGREYPAAFMLSGNKQLLKERLSVIMNFKKKTAAARLLTGGLTVCVIVGASFFGGYPAAAAGSPAGVGDGRPLREEAGDSRYSAMAERYYAAESFPLFQLIFPRLEEKVQGEWLERFYADGDVAFFSVALSGLNPDSPLRSAFAGRAYAGGETAFFSTLADRMTKEEQEFWLDRALEEGNWAFQSLLFDRLDREGKFDERKEAWEEEWERAQAAEYEAVGVTVDGKDYHYHGQLVGIFLDVRANQSFYTLNVNPKGTVHVKILRDGDNAITGAVYLTEAEAAALLGDMGED